MKTCKKILTISLTILFFLILGSLIAVKCLTYTTQDKYYDVSTSLVTVTADNSKIFYDGPGTDDALIFYPGGFVDYRAYSDLLKAIALNGIDCFVVKMPLNFAFLGINKADSIIENYHYDNWFIGGHSLGGVVACKFAQDNSSNLKGIVLFASYSVYDLSNSGLNVISIYGSNDNILNLEAYYENKNNLPENFNELVISGANHCQFGSYGFQKGDNTADISHKQQIEEAVSFLVNAI